MTDGILDGPTHQHEVVAFRVADQDFCFDLASVLEIRGWTATTALPHAQSHVKGVINLRGSVVPVVDLSERLGFGVTDPGDRHVIIIVEIEQRIVGMLAEVVSDILFISEDHMHPIPDILDEAAHQFISGVFVDQDQILRRLDPGAVVGKDWRDVA